MRGSFSIFALSLLSLSHLAKSQIPCTPDVAVPLDNDTSTSGTASTSGSDSDPGAAAAVNAIDAAAQETAIADANILGGDDDDSNPPLRRVLKRAGLECANSEGCYSIQDALLCVNNQTYAFHAADGTIGNLQTGNYTLPDGESGNFVSGPYPTGTGTAASGNSATGTGTGNVSATATGTQGVESGDVAGGTSTTLPASARETFGAKTEAAATPSNAGGSGSSSTRTQSTSSTTNGAASAASSGHAIGEATTQKCGSSIELLLVAMGLMAVL